MTVNYDILPGGICVTPCPHGRSAKVFSLSCRECACFAGLVPLELSKVYIEHYKTEAWIMNSWRVGQSPML